MAFGFQNPWTNPWGGSIPGINGQVQPPGGAFSSPQINGGVFGEDQSAAKRDAMMAAAAQLLAGSGWSPQRRSFGELVGQAMLAGQNARAQSLDRSQERRLREAQIGAIQSKDTSPIVIPKGSTVLDRQTNTPLYTSAEDGMDHVGNYNPGDYTPDTWAKFASGGFKDPAILVRYATPREQNPYFRDVTRTNPDGSTSQGVFNSRTGAYSWPNPVVPAGTKAEVDAAGRVRGETHGGIDKKGITAQSVLDTLDIAEPLIDIATGSATGAAMDKAAAFFGNSTDGAKATAQLKILQAGLMLNMPRMEGPQSDNDTQLYREAAGQLGDPTVPRDTKKAAVKTIREIQLKYQEQAGIASPAKPAKRVKVDAQGNVVGN